MPGEHLAALRTNGFVKSLARGRQGTTYRLCYRVAGRQVTHSLGRDCARAASVQAALERLRAPTRLHRRAEQALQKSRALVRTMKRQLAAELASCGAYFHGQRIRRRRHA